MASVPRIVLLALLACAAADVADLVGGENNTNDTEIDMFGDGPTVKTTSFTVLVTLNSVDDFDIDEFRNAMAISLSIDADDVSMNEATFTISTSVTFATAVTNDQVTIAVANANKVAQSVVDVVISQARRLADGGRRLQTKFDASISIPAANSAKAASVMQSVGDTSVLATELGLAADDVAIGAPSLAVEVKAVVKTTQAGAIEPPTKQTFTDGLKAVSGKVFVVNHVGEPSFVVPDGSPTSAPTSAPSAAPTAAPSATPTVAPTQEEEESSAIGVSANLVRAMCTVMCAAAMNVAFA